MSQIYEALQRANRETGKVAPDVGKKALPAKAPSHAQGGVPLGRLGPVLSPLYGSVRRLIDQADGGIVLHFVSTMAGEGTSTIARELALLASQTGHRNTLLLDGASNDWATATTFQCPTDRGVADMILQGKLIDDVLRPVEGANLLVGSLRGENSPSLSAASAHTVYGALRARFELTVIDCPSINTGRYPDIVPEASDGIVLIVQAEKNRPEVVQHAKGLVEQAGGTFVAAVLNRRRIYIPRMLYNLM